MNCGAGKEPGHCFFCLPYIYSQTARRCIYNHSVMHLSTIQCWIVRQYDKEGGGEIIYNLCPQVLRSACSPPPLPQSPKKKMQIEISVECKIMADCHPLCDNNPR